MLKLFDKLDRYLIDNNHKVTIEKNRVHIINYIEIVDFSSDRVKLKYSDGLIILLGKDLVVSKMLEDELLIMGKLRSIEYK